MKKYSFNDMLFARASDAWCPITGRAVGPNNPRVHPERILASVGNIPIYYRFPESQGFVRYSNEVGCYDRVSERTHVFTDELDALELRLVGTGCTRGSCGLGLSQDGRPLEIFARMNDAPEYFLVDTLIHGNEPDGILGTLKALEVLMTHDDFAPLRSQYNIVFMSCCNPDGYYLGTRNINLLGPHPSEVPTGINLNRVWPWFWDEFIPTAGESKGDAPITCCLEATAMEAWRNNFGSPRAVAWALDQHSTAGDGARYASRDRCFRNLGEDEYEKLWADWTIHRLLRAIQTKRVHEGPNPDLWINYFRSRWRPHWHSYLSTLAPDDNGGIPCCSFVGEHNKVSSQVVSADLETYKSASDFNFDHIIAMALVAQGGITERKPAVLVEHEEGVNQVTNPSFTDWSTLGEYRPKFWKGTRGNFLQTSRADQHMQSNGRPIRMEVDVLLEVAAPAYCLEDSGSDIVYQYGSYTEAMLLAFIFDEEEVPELHPAIYTWDYTSSPIFLTMIDIPADDSKQWRIGKADPEGPIYLLGTGDATSVYSCNLYKFTQIAGVWSYTTLYNWSSPLEDAAVALHDVTGNLYIFGGTTDSGDAETILLADCTADTLTEIGEDLLDVADHGMGICYCAGGYLSQMIVLIGGQYDGTLGMKVRVFDPSDDSLTVYYAQVPAGETPFGAFDPGIMHCGVVYDTTDTIWIYGGENPTISAGSVYSNILSIKWNGAGFDDIVTHELNSGLSDDGDPEDYDGKEKWNRPFRNWRGLRTFDEDSGNYSHSLFGGLERLPDGTDEDDLSMRRGFYAHMLSTEEFGRPSDYNFGYARYNSALDVSAHDKAAVTWSVRAGTVDDSTRSAAYARLNNAPGDSDAGVLTTRRARTYYMHPPQWWWRSQASIDLSMAKPGVVEDELRVYARGYRQGQEVWAADPMVQFDTLWPSSWSPAGMTRESEEAAWLDSVDPRWFRLQFDWVPAAPFMATTNGIPLLKIGDYSGNAYGLWAINPTDASVREYNRGNIVSTSAPALRLIRDMGEGSDYVDLPCYWGGHLRDTAYDRFDTAIQIEIWNHASIGSGLVVRNGWAEGWIRLSPPSHIVEWTAPGGVFLLGGGWWGEPQALPMDATWKSKYTKRDFVNGALLIGDRDPTSGQVSVRGAFRYTETFTRGNSDNLGDNWNIIEQTGAGWNISSNKARCAELGWERWISYPYVSDCSVLADVSAPDGGKVGLFTRLHWALTNDLFAHGYAGYLHCTGASTANLIIARYYRDVDGIQQVSVLATQAVTYTASATVTLEMSAVGDTLTLTMSGAHTGVATITDSNHQRPGAFGLFGETPGAGQYVLADNIRASVPTSTKIRITE